jgi:hypothetical protein
VEEEEAFDRKREAGAVGKARERRGREGEVDGEEDTTAPDQSQSTSVPLSKVAACAGKFAAFSGNFDVTNINMGYDWLRRGVCIVFLLFT